MVAFIINPVKGNAYYFKNSYSIIALISSSPTAVLRFFFLLLLLFLYKLETTNQIWLLMPAFFRLQMEWEWIIVCANSKPEDVPQSKKKKKKKVIINLQGFCLSHLSVFYIIVMKQMVVLQVLSPFWLRGHDN